MSSHSTIMDCEEMEDDCDRGGGYLSPSTMNSPQNYEDLLNEINQQLHFHGGFHDIHTILEKLSETLDNIYNLITRSFETMQNFLLEGDIDKVLLYLENKVGVIQNLGKYLQSIHEINNSDYFDCKLYGFFPKKVADVVKIVFLHCKTSEVMYHDVMNEVSSKLKDLFRCCRELQTIYLDILQNKLIFLPDNLEDMRLLAEALKINIEIGETVTALDVKTMAEQWLCVSNVCHKFSNGLTQHLTSHLCTSTLAAIIIENVQLCTDEEREEKSLQRLLKVNNFLVKIIVKMCQTFKENTSDDYSQIITLLFDILCVESRMVNLPQEVKQLVLSETSNLSELLIVALVDNQHFAQVLLSNSQSDEYDIADNIQVLSSIISIILRKDDAEIFDLWLETAGNIACVLLNLLPKYPGFPSDVLRESLLGTLTVLVTQSPRYANIEPMLFDITLTGDDWVADFAGDIIVLVARIAPIETVLEELRFLIKNLTKLSTVPCTKHTPFFTRLSILLRRIFCVLPHEHRSNILREFDWKNNMSAWISVGIENLPEIQREEVSKKIFDELNCGLRKLLKGDIGRSHDLYKLIDTINLSSTCVPQSVPTDNIINCLLKCYPNPAMSVFYEKEEFSNRNNVWFYDLAAALMDLASALIRRHAVGEKEVIQVLNVTMAMISKSPSIIKLQSIGILKSIGNYKINENAYTSSICDLTSQLFVQVLKDEDRLVKYKSMEAFKYFSLHTNREEMIKKIANSDAKLKEEIVRYLKTESEFFDTEVLNNVFTRKCNYGNSDKCVEFKSSLSSNFEFGDVDAIFGEIDEFECKKRKLNNENVTAVISRIENDVSVLNESVICEEEMRRIKRLISILQNIVN